MLPSLRQVSLYARLDQPKATMVCLGNSTRRLPTLMLMNAWWRSTEPILGVRYLLGPAPLLVDQQENPGARLTGEVLQTASARLQVLDWVVNISFRSGSPGIDDFNALASECSRGTQVCPPTGTSPNTGAFVGRVAVEIDGIVESAPTVSISNFDRGQVVISGGAMTEQVAKDLALVLRFGSLPVELTPQESRIVSSTLGEDALDAGIVAGIIGLALVSLYLLV